VVAGGPVEERTMAGFEVVAVVGFERTVIRCEGELDVGQCAKLIDMFDHVLAGEAECVVADLSDVTFIDSTGIGCLLHGALRAEKLGMTFEVRPGKAVAHFLEVSGLGGHFRH
jgi:anti-sigma B factor antagonist